MGEGKARGGVAPFGYRWRGGRLVVDGDEAPVRRLIFELFLKHRRKKTVAKLLNDLGHRTRSASLFSDTTVDRLLRDTTAKGVREVDGRIVQVEAIVPEQVWERANDLLGNSKPAKQTTHLFTGKAFCHCGGRMMVPGNTPKYVCVDCRRKILVEDLEAVFRSQMKNFPDSEYEELHEHWDHFTPKEKRILVEQVCERIDVGRDAIAIRFGFGYSPHPLEAVTDGQRNETGNESPETAPSSPADVDPLNEPLLSEADAAKFLGISKMTVLRKRNAGELGYFRVGHRILYSKGKHLIPYLKKCEEMGLGKQAIWD